MRRVRAMVVIAGSLSSFACTSGGLSSGRADGAPDGGAIGSGGAPLVGGRPGTGGSPATGGAFPTGGVPAATGGAMTCSPAPDNVVPCRGNVTGSWTVIPSPLRVGGRLDLSSMGVGCASATVTDGCLGVSGTWTVRDDGSFTDRTTTQGEVRFSLSDKCLSVSGTRLTCAKLAAVLPFSLGLSTVTCDAVQAGGCDCVGTVEHGGGMGMLSANPIASGPLKITDVLTYPDASSYDYCATGNQLALSARSPFPSVTGTIQLAKGAGGNRSTGGTPASGGSVVTGGSLSTGGERSCSSATANVTPCRGDVIGTWRALPSPLQVGGQLDLAPLGIGCTSATVTGGCLWVAGSWAARADGTFTDRTTTTGELRFSIAGSCLTVEATPITCAMLIKFMSTALGFAAATCQAALGGGCDCVGVVDQVGGAGIPNGSPIVEGHLTIDDRLVYPDASSYGYCATGDQLALSALGKFPTVTGIMRFERVVGGTGGIPAR